MLNLESLTAIWRKAAQAKFTKQIWKSNLFKDLVRSNVNYLRECSSSAILFLSSQSISTYISYSFSLFFDGLLSMCCTFTFNSCRNVRNFVIWFLTKNKFTPVIQFAWVSVDTCLKNSQRSHQAAHLIIERKDYRPIANQRIVQDVWRLLRLVCLILRLLQTRIGAQLNGYWIFFNLIIVRIHFAGFSFIQTQCCLNLFLERNKNKSKLLLQQLI